MREEIILEKNICWNNPQEHDEIIVKNMINKLNMLIQKQ